MGQALEMCVNCENKRGCDLCPDLHEWIMEHLDAVPVRHGKWIEDTPHRDAEGYIIQQFYCSECGRYEEEREPYCNCGAMMDLDS